MSDYHVIFEIYFTHKRDGALEVVNAPQDVTIHNQKLDGKKISIWDTVKDDGLMRGSSNEKCERYEIVWRGHHNFPVGPIDAYGLYYGQVLMNYSECMTDCGTEYDWDYHLLYCVPVKKIITKPRVLRILIPGLVYLPVTDAFDMVETVQHTQWGIRGILT